MSRLCVFLLFLFISVTSYAGGNYQKLLKPYLQNPVLVGSGQYRHYFFKIYKAYLYAENQKYQEQKPFALVLAYQRDLSGSDIVEKTIDLIKEQTPFIGEGLANKWKVLLVNIFPNVDDKSSLIGIRTASGGTVFINEDGKVLGEIKSKQFTKYFFNIWLGPQTQDVNFRNQLLGKLNES
ncbi:MAG: hypothetical protein ACJA0H_001035 [Francisellaceae bacterium]|jgi:hypothetical protein